MKRMTQGRLGRASLVLVLGSAVALGVPAGNPNAGADDATDAPGFVATATAGTIRAQYDVPGFMVVENIFDGGGAFSQSQVDTNGGYGFASMPYPGQTVINGPGILAGFGGIALPAGYPFYAVASYPTAPSSKTSDPSKAYALSAAAGARSASGTARFAGSSGASSVGTNLADTAIKSLDDGTLLATAESLVEGLSINDGLLTIGSIRSTSVTTLPPGGHPETKQTLEIRGAKVGDTPVSIGPGGVTLASASVPAPPSGAAAALNSVLEARGLTVHIVESRDTNGGRQGAMLEVRSTEPVPAPGSPKGTMTLNFGAVSTSVLVGSPSGEVVAPAPDVAGGSNSSYPPGSPAGGVSRDEKGVSSLPASLPAPMPTKERVSELPVVQAVTTPLEQEPPEARGASESSGGKSRVAGATSGSTTRVQVASAMKLDLDETMDLLYLIVGIGGLVVGVAASVRWGKGMRTT